MVHFGKLYVWQRGYYELFLYVTKRQCVAYSEKWGLSIFTQRGVCLPARRVIFFFRHCAWPPARIRVIFFTQRCVCLRVRIVIFFTRHCAWPPARIRVPASVFAPIAKVVRGSRSSTFRQKKPEHCTKNMASSFEFLILVAQISSTSLAKLD